MRRFFNTVLIVSLLTFLAKMAIVCKELVVSSRYGRQDEVDAFLIAFLIPSFIISILNNAMNTAFIPVYVEVREKEGKAAAQRLFTGMTILTLVASLAIAVLTFLLAPLFLPLIASGFSGPKLELTRHLLLLVTPTLLFSGVFSLWGALANAQEKYALVVLTPILTPLLIIVLLYLAPSRGIYSLADGSLLGSFLELLVVGVFLRARGFLQGLRDGSRSDLRSVAVKKVLSQFLPASAGALLMISTLLVDQAMAATLPAGSVAALSYGNKVIGFLLTILSTTLATILTPLFSKKISGGGIRELYRPLRRWMPLLFGAAFLLPLLITVYSEPLIRLVFYRGAFTPEDVKMVAGVQSWLAWQIPFYISSIILLKFIASMQLNWIQAFVAGVSLVVNIVLNLVLMKSMGVDGIALSTTLVYVLSFSLLLFFVYFSGKRAVKPIVLHVITDLDTGGAERMLCNLLSGMDRGAWESVVLSLMPGGAQSEVLKGLGIPVYTAGMQPGRPPPLGGLVRMIRLAWKIRPSLIQGWMYHGNLSAQFLRLFLFRRVPVFWSIHHSIADLGREKKLTQRLIGFGARLSVRPDQIIYVSVVSRQQHAVLGYRDTKARVIPNGVEPNFFIPSPEARGLVRTELGLGEDVLLIGALARYHPMKDHENFFRAAGLLAERYPEVHYILAGARVDRDNPDLQNLIHELGLEGRVHLLGERADSERLLAAMDLFSLSSAYGEAFPMVLLEAMSCGVPCVSTDIGDASRIVGDTGLIVPVRDPAALSAAWETLLEKGAEGRRNLGNKAREKILQNHSLQGVVREYEALYRRFLFGNRSPS